jgi:hypothetical protein
MTDEDCRVAAVNANLLAAAPKLLEALEKIAALDPKYGATNFAATKAVVIAREAITDVNR